MISIGLDQGAGLKVQSWYVYFETQSMIDN